MGSKAYRGDIRRSRRSREHCRRRTCHSDVQSRKDGERGEDREILELEFHRMVNSGQKRENVLARTKPKHPLNDEYQ